MRLDDLVDLFHQADRLGECDDDLVVVGDVVVGELATRLTLLRSSVLEPLLANLVATDVEVPHILDHAPKPNGLSLVDPHGVT